MAFNTSNAEFERIFGVDQQTPVESFRGRLLDYLYTKANAPSAVEMAKWIDSNQPVVAFSCREDLCLPVVEKLYCSKIPYVTMVSDGGKIGFILRQTDTAAIEQAKEEVLEEKSRICTVITGAQMAQQASQSREQDKSCLTIHGLTRGQAEIMKRKYAQHFEAAKVGLDRRKDDTFDFTVFGRESVKRNNRGGPDICTVFLETIIETSGPNSNRLVAEATTRSIFMERLANNFEDPNVNMNKMPLWIVGTGTNYMRISASDFVYGHVTQARNKELEFNPEARADTIQPDYHEMLVSYAARFCNPIMTYDKSEVIAHFGGTTDSNLLSPVANIPSAKSRAYARGEREMSVLMDTMITRKIASDPIMTMDGRWGEKFQHYANTAKAFMGSIALGRMPQGYEAAELSKLQTIMEKHGLDGSMYSQAGKNIDRINAIAITDTKERIANVAEKIGASRDAIEQEKAREKAERMAARGGHGKMPPSRPYSGKSREED